MAAKRRLGRGLDGLLPAAPKQTNKTETRAAIEDLTPGRGQPRRRFDDEALNELAASIEAHGILEPILVRKKIKGGYEIVAGERRWRAAQRAGLREVPIFVRELSESALFEAALVENLQREDLNPIESALAFERLREEFGLSQDEIANRIGKNRSTVANALRLLKLPQTVLDEIEGGALSEGHGRALLSAKDERKIVELAKLAIRKKLSVRALEKLAKEETSTKKQNKQKPKKSANVLDLERRLSHSMGATVSVHDKKGGKGHLEIRYASYEELDRIISILGR